MKKIKKITSAYLLLLFTICFLSACSKKNDDVSIDEETNNTTVDFHKIHRVENLYAYADENSANSNTETMYFSLEAKKTTPANYSKTNRWDIAFGNLYNSFLSGNNSKDSKNYGYGASSNGGILIIDKAFEEVIDIPNDNEFLTGKDIYGTDPNGDLNENGRLGWYLYDFGGIIVGDGSFDKTHIAYTLANPLTLKSGKTISPRTIIIRTAAGNYAKLKMISVYKDLFSLEQWYRLAPKMYFTFEYVLAPKGSTKFEIK